MNPAELLELAEGDAEVAGWLAGQLLAGHELPEIRATMQTARTNLQSLGQQEDGIAVLRALGVCMGMRNYPMPLWLRERLGAAIAARLEWSSTLDDALRLPAFKQVAKERDRHLWTRYICQRVERLQAEGMGTDEGLFTVVADEIVAMSLGMGEANPRMSWSKVRAIYYAAQAEAE